MAAAAPAAGGAAVAAAAASAATVVSIVETDLKRRLRAWAAAPVQVSGAQDRKATGGGPGAVTEAQEARHDICELISVESVHDTNLDVDLKPPPKGRPPIPNAEACYTRRTIVLSHPFYPPTDGGVDAAAAAGAGGGGGEDESDGNTDAAAAAAAVERTAHRPSFVVTRITPTPALMDATRFREPQWGWAWRPGHTHKGARSIGGAGVQDGSQGTFTNPVLPNSDVFVGRVVSFHASLRVRLSRPASATDDDADAAEQQRRACDEFVLSERAERVCVNRETESGARRRFWRYWYADTPDERTVRIDGAGCERKERARPLAAHHIAHAEHALADLGLPLTRHNFALFSILCGAEYKGAAAAAKAAPNHAGRHWDDDDGATGTGGFEELTTRWRGTCDAYAADRARLQLVVRRVLQRATTTTAATSTTALDADAAAAAAAATASGVWPNELCDVVFAHTSSLDALRWGNAVGAAALLADTPATGGGGARAGPGAGRAKGKGRGGSRGGRGRGKRH